MLKECALLWNFEPCPLLPQSHPHEGHHIFQKKKKCNFLLNKRGLVYVIFLLRFPSSVEGITAAITQNNQPKKKKKSSKLYSLFKKGLTVFIPCKFVVAIVFIIRFNPKTCAELIIGGCTALHRNIPIKGMIKIPSLL